VAEEIQRHLDRQVRGRLLEVLAALDHQRRVPAALDRMLVEVIGGEFEAPGLPVVTGLDFGHTDPQWLLPLGVRAGRSLTVVG